MNDLSEFEFGASIVGGLVGLVVVAAWAWHRYQAHIAIIETRDFLRELVEIARKQNADGRRLASGTRRCAACGLVNPASATKCDCGASL